MSTINQDALNILFLEAHTHNGWQNTPVADELLKQVYDIAKMAPTSANCQPMRITFVKTPEAKAKLKPHLDTGNVEKTMAAPVVAIIAYDLEFYHELPRLFPHANAKAWFEGQPEKIRYTAFQNGTLQGGYFLLAARGLGLDCGPMSGFNRDGVDQAFFSGTSIKSNFLCNLGYGDPSKLYPRSPRPAFEEFCRFV